MTKQIAKIGLLLEVMKKRAIFILIILGALVRLVTLSKLMVFTPDEEYLLYIAQTLVKDFHIIWIGVSALGLDFYMGPFWIYIIYPFVAIFKGDPIILGVMTSVIGLCTIILLYWLGKKMFDAKSGFIAALIYTFSSVIIYYDQQPYPPAVPLLSLLLVASLFMTKFSKKWWVLFAIFYGMVFHIHLSLTLMIFVGLYWAFIKRKSLNRKIIATSVLAFLITISPLIAFDYFHNASNITTPIRVLKSIGTKKTHIDINKRSDILFKAMGRIWYLDSHKNNADEILYPCNQTAGATTTKPHWIFSIITLILFLKFVFKKDIWKDERKRLLLITSLSFLVPFLFLPIINPVEYYLLGFFPLLFIIIGVSIASMKNNKKYLAYLLLGVFVIYSIFTVVTAKGDFGIDTKKTLIAKVMNVVADAPYEVQTEGKCHDAEGWRYLFSVYAIKPERSSEDKVFSWLWPVDEITNKPLKYSVVARETRAELPEYASYKSRFELGGFTLYIFEH